MSAKTNILTAVIGIGAAISLSIVAINLVYPPYDLGQINGYAALGMFAGYLIYGVGGSVLLYLFYRRTKTSNLNLPKRTV